MHRPKGLRTAEIRPPIWTRALLGRSVVDVADDVEVEIPVAVEVAEGGRGRKALYPGSRRGGHVDEGAVPPVAIEPIGTVVGHEQVDVSVVVDVADRDAHAVAPVTEARLRGDVRVAPVGLAAVEPVGRPVRGARLGQDVIGVGQVDVEIAVGVEVEQRRTTGADRREMQLVEGARLVDEIESRLLGDVREPLRGRSLDRASLAHFTGVTRRVTAGCAERQHQERG